MIKTHSPNGVRKIMIDINNFLKAFDNSKKYHLTEDNMTINSILDLGDYYVVSVVPKNIKINETFEGGLFKVDKNLSNISPFSVDNDRAKYLSALKNRLLYKRTKKILI